MELEYKLGSKFNIGSVLSNNQLPLPTPPPLIPFLLPLLLPPYKMSRQEVELEQIIRQNQEQLTVL